MQKDWEAVCVCGGLKTFWLVFCNNGQHDQGVWKIAATRSVRETQKLEQTTTVVPLVYTRTNLLQSQMRSIAVTSWFALVCTLVRKCHACKLGCNMQTACRLDATLISVHRALERLRFVHLVVLILLFVLHRSLDTLQERLYSIAAAEGHGTTPHVAAVFDVNVQRLTDCG